MDEGKEGDQRRKGGLQVETLNPSLTSGFRDRDVHEENDCGHTEKNEWRTSCGGAGVEEEKLG